MVLQGSVVVVVVVVVDFGIVVVVVVVVGGVTVEHDFGIVVVVVVAASGWLCAADVVVAVAATTSALSAMESDPQRKNHRSLRRVTQRMYNAVRPTSLDHWPHQALRLVLRSGFASRAWFVVDPRDHRRNRRLGPRSSASW